MSNSITLAGIGNIHTDADGRFSLNDFHKAAGSFPHQKPSEWLSNKQTQELAEEIGKAGIPAFTSIRGGRNAGTYVCKELVYAYAMWISAPFQLKVIRAFDALVTGDVDKAQTIAHGRPIDTLRQARALSETESVAARICARFPSLGEQSQQVIYAKLINTIAGHEVIPLPLLEEKFYTATEVGKEVRQNANNIGRIANKHGLKSRDGKYGKFFLDKSAHSDKQVEAFRYNAAGISKIRELLSSNDSRSEVAA